MNELIQKNSLWEVRDCLAGIKVCLFDLDDTLYSEKEYVRSGFHAIADAMPEIRGCEERLWQAFLRGQKAIDVILQEENIYSEAYREKCLEIYRKHIPAISLYEEAVELLQTLKAREMKLGIITDGRVEGQSAKIRALQLQKYFEKIIITDELGGIEFRKPNPAAFVQMQDYFQVPYEQMAYVGDNYSKDFQAPLALHMRAIWVDNPDGLYGRRN